MRIDFHHSSGQSAVKHSFSALAVAGLLIAAALAGCASPLALSGQVQNSRETLTGSASRDSQGTGTLTLVSSTGALCHGDFVFTSRRFARGTLTCDDQRSGAFQMASTNFKGTGSGTLGRERFTFEISE